MKSKIVKFLLIFAITIVALCAGFYFLVALTYKEGFTYNTYINGVFCTGRSVEDVNKDLLSEFDETGILVLCDGKSEIIKLSDIDFSIDYENTLTKLYNGQNPWLWFLNLNQSYIDNQISPDISYDSDKLKGKILELDAVKTHDISRPQVYRVSKYAGSFYLDENLHTTLNPELVYEKCVDAVKDSFIVQISQDDLLDPVFTDEMKVQSDLWSKLTDFLETRIYYDMGEEIIPIDETVLSDFVVLDDKGTFLFDENGDFIIDREAVNKFIDSLCDKYDTYELPRMYKTFSGEEKYIETCHYGTLINRDVEKDYLYNAIANKESDNHIPKYRKTPYFRGLNDIGDEFIEVDLTNQKLIYVRDGEVLLEANVVTGKPETETPEMICAVYKKKTDTYLTGSDYRSHVNYWMAVHNKIGIHDATWQRSFGGERYLLHGSHGCINMQKSKAAKLYDLISVGVPVIIYK